MLNLSPSLLDDVFQSHPLLGLHAGFPSEEHFLLFRALLDFEKIDISDEDAEDAVTTLMDVPVMEERFNSIPLEARRSIVIRRDADNVVVPECRRLLWRFLDFCRRTGGGRVDLRVEPADSPGQAIYLLSKSILDQLVSSTNMCRHVDSKI